MCSYQGGGSDDANSVVGFDADQARELIVELEGQSRRLEATKIDLMNTIRREGVHRDDGHVSPKVMVRHVAQLSAGEAAARDAVSRLMLDLVDVAGAYRAGVIGTPQIRRLARVHRNPRVRHRMSEFESQLLEAAIEMEYIDYDRFVAEWERMADEDGAEPRAETNHRRRDVTLVQDFNLAWKLAGRFGSLDGAIIDDILRHFAEAERLADIEEAKAEHGDEYRLHLSRSEQQLRADALTKIFRLAAGAPPGSSESRTTTNLVIDLETFDREVAKKTNASVRDRDPLDPTRQCRTADGVPLVSAEVVAEAICGHVRRVVIDAQSAVIDLGRRSRLFTGAAREAAMLQTIRCYWPGCWIPATRCQIDHLVPFRDGGSTSPGNGAPACGRHNRLKEHGYRAWRDPSGTWLITRPDGATIT